VDGHVEVAERAPAPNHDGLSPPFDRRHARAFEDGHVAALPPVQIAGGHTSACDGDAEKSASKLANDGLDFGKLGHAVSIHDTALTS
jgi:hypothetical protein